MPPPRRSGPDTSRDRQTEASAKSATTVSITPGGDEGNRLDWIPPERPEPRWIGCPCGCLTRLPWLDDPDCLRHVHDHGLAYRARVEPVRALDGRDSVRALRPADPSDVEEGLSLMDPDAAEAYRAGNHWSAITGEFIAHRGAVRFVSLAYRRRRCA